MNKIGPRKISNSLLLSKLFGGILGGFGSTMSILLIIFIINAMNVSTNIFSFFSALLIAIIATLIGNILAILFFSFFDSNHYRDISGTIIQIFTFNIIFTIFLTPLYFLAKQKGIDIVFSLLIFHLSLSAFMSYFIAESISNSRHFLVAIYGASFSLLVILFINFFVMSGLNTDVARTVSLLIAMPLAWGMIGLFGTVAEMVYAGFYNVYGIDFLSSNVELYQDNDNN